MIQNSIIGIVGLTIGLIGLILTIKDILRKEIKPFYYFKKNPKVKYSEKPSSFIFFITLHLIIFLLLIYGALRLLIS